MNLSMAKVSETVRFARDSANDWHLVAFEAGKPVAIGAARIVEMPWFERSEAHVYAMFSEAPGAGTHILRALMAWYADQPMIRRLLWPLEWDAPIAMLRYAERAGFNSSHVNVTHYKV